MGWALPSGKPGEGWPIARAAQLRGARRRQPTLMPGQRGRGNDRDRKAGLGTGCEVQPRLARLEPFGLHRDQLRAGQKTQHNGQRLLHLPLPVRGVASHHVGIGNRRVWPAIRHHPPLRHGGRAARTAAPGVADCGRAGWSYGCPAVAARIQPFAALLIALDGECRDPRPRRGRGGERSRSAGGLAASCHPHIAGGSPARNSSPP